jgi:SAM-dependent methyltransferase
MIRGKGLHVEAPLHTLNPTGRFADRAVDYALYRPSYAGGAIDAVLAGLGDPRGVIAADIGAGTGISSRLLADRGVRVLAVEPNRAMRENAAIHPLVEWRKGRAEETGLDAESVDLVLSAQAFHWFEREQALAEFARVLRRGGRLALMWNEGDKGDALTKTYYDLVSTAAGDTPVLKVRGAPEAFWTSEHFENKREQTFAHAQDLDEDGLVGRALSASYVPREGPARATLERGLREAYRSAVGAGGCGQLRYLTRVYLAERSA